MSNNTSLISSSDTQREVERFLYFQAEVLDERRWEDWLDLFADDGVYWMPASKDQDTGENQPNIFYEDYDLMSMRIRRVEHPYAHSQAAGHRTTHVVSNVMIQNESECSSEILVTSRFHMLEYRLDDQRYFGGKYTHRLKRVESGYKIQLQRVDLVNVEGPFDYVMQVWI